MVEMAWFLESIASDGSRVTQPIRKLPFRIGRDIGNDLAGLQFECCDKRRELLFVFAFGAFVRFSVWFGSTFAALQQRQTRGCDIG